MIHPCSIFSKFANQYVQDNCIQQEVASELFEFALKFGAPFKSSSRFLDLGCGAGEMLKAFLSHDFGKVDLWMGVDGALEMCNLHPTPPYVKILQADFDDGSLWDTICVEEVDMVLSSSALHWSKNLNNLVKSIAKMKVPVVASIFSKKTFLEFHQKLGIVSILPSKEQIQESFSCFGEVQMCTKVSRQDFLDTYSLLRFISRTGIGGGQSLTGSSKLLSMVRENEMTHLEFEVAYVYATP